MASIMCVCTPTNGIETVRSIDVPVFPEVWDPSDAQACVRLLQMATASRARPLQQLVSVHVHDTEDPCVVTIEVVTNAGTALTEPIRVDAMALAWLDELSDTFVEEVPAWWAAGRPFAAVGRRLH